MEEKERKTYMKDYMKKYRKTHKEKGKRVSVTLTHQEYLQLKKSAKEQKQTPTKRLKELAFYSLNEKESIPIDTQESFSQFVHILRGIGNNINQMARYSNTFKKIQDEGKVLHHLQLLEEKIKTFISTNGK
jgi:hypothetical protein